MFFTAITGPELGVILNQPSMVKFLIPNPVLPHDRFQLGSLTVFPLHCTLTPLFNTLVLRAARHRADADPGTHAVSGPLRLHFPSDSRSYFPERTGHDN